MCNIFAQVILMEGSDKELEELRRRRAEAAKAPAPEVLVYSTPTCRYCVLVKEYLAAKGVKFTDYDVSQDMARAKEMVSKTGQMGVPVLQINGRIVVGFNRPLIDDALERRPLPRRDTAIQNVIYDPFDRP